MTDLELDVWDAWLRERQKHLEETLSNTSPSEEPCRYYLLTGYIQGMIEALTMLTTVEDGKRFKIKLEQFRQKLLLGSGFLNSSAVTAYTQQSISMFGMTYRIEF